MAILRVSGFPGSGKTTLCKKLATELGYTYHYAGGIFRAMAAERGQTIEEFYREISIDPELERSVDTRQEQMMQGQDNLIMEGRIAPFQSAAFPTCNIFLTVTPEEGARRELGRTENKSRTIAEMMALTAERVENERRHYKALYGIENHFDTTRFDIVLDTTVLSPEHVFASVLAQLQPYLKTSTVPARL